MAYQTRDLDGSLAFFNSFAEAYAHYKKNSSIWKISWDNNRWCSKQKCELWAPDSEEKLCKLSQAYAKETPESTAIFWVQQLPLPPNIKEILADNTLSEEEKHTLIRLGCIQAIVTDTEFSKY